MTIKELQEHLTRLLKEKKNKPTDQVRFRHTIHESGPSSSVDYLLTAQEPRTLLLCYDDGHF